MRPQVVFAQFDRFLDQFVYVRVHAREFSLPGKGVGLSDKDWPDIIMGSIPNINPWIIDNLGESLPV
ncbi:MAG: cobaltochelatase subunit CobN, partial [Candidatus Lindowbacteria bacterium]|nr:cobaltochelatase subunit CobN [Candidatus Lindowbacteria bacterium]